MRHSFPKRPIRVVRLVNGEFHASLDIPNRVIAFDVTAGSAKAKVRKTLNSQRKVRKLLAQKSKTSKKHARRVRR